MNIEQLRDFAARYTAVWCSRDAPRVAAFFAEGGSLTINRGAPAFGRAAIAAAAQGFMTAFPDLRVTMDGASLDGERAVYHWTLTGTNTGPGGTGKAVRLSGHEEWTIGADGLIARSLGHFDEAEYRRQLESGARSVLTRVLNVRRWTAAGLLAIVALAYPLTWEADPFIFGVALLVLTPLQFVLALAGTLARLARLDPARGPGPWLIDVLLAATGAGALAFVRTISWT